MLEICFVRLMVKYPAEHPHEHKELDINIMYHCGFEVMVPISNLVMLFLIFFFFKCSFVYYIPKLSKFLFFLNGPVFNIRSDLLV